MNLKLNAVILLFCLVAYVVEWIAMPGKLAKVTAPICKNSCCARHQMTDKAQPDNKKPGSGPCNTTGTFCLDCPMCSYVAVFPDASAFTHPAIDPGRFFHPYKLNYLSRYFCDAWKPPNPGHSLS